MTKKNEAKKVSAKTKNTPTSYFIDFENVRGAGLTGVENLGKKDRVVVLYGSKDSSLRISQVESVMQSAAKVEFVKVSTGKPNALDFQLIAMLFMDMKKKRKYVIVSKDRGFDFAIRMAKERGAGNVVRLETISGDLLPQKKLPQPKKQAPKQLPQPRQAQSAQQKQPQGAQEKQAQGEQPKQGQGEQAKPAGGKPQGNQASAPQKDPYRVAVERVLGKHLGGLPVAKKVDIVIAALEKCDTKAQFYNYLRGNMGNEKGLAFYRDIKGCFEQLRALEK